jgi:hypothetical protein
MLKFKGGRICLLFITVSNITVPANATVAAKAYVIGSAGAWIYLDDFELIKN